jgi:acyl-CoA synthetase (AMP-forming)/AMP-acid ligase II/pimeloyl-ACP methyl ester carboxylesterase
MLDKKLYPFKNHFFNLDGLRYHYVDEGEGETIVMLHGNPTWSFYYRNLIKALRPHYRVIAPDHIGMGLSDKPDDTRYHYTYSRRLTDLGKLLDHLNLTKFTLIGHDWGGIIGTAYASLNPEKIDGMIMLNTCGFMWPVTKKLPFILFLARIPFISTLFIRGLNAFVRLAISFGMTRNRISAEAAQGYKHPYGSWRDRIAIHRFIQDIPIRPSDPGYDLGLLMESRLKLLRHLPMLLCFGLKDVVFCKKMLDEWLRHFPNAEVHTFDDAGHLILEDATEDVIPLVERFIRTKIYSGIKIEKKERLQTQETDPDFIDLTSQFLNRVKQNPNGLAVAHMKGMGSNDKGLYDCVTYETVDRESNRIAHGLEKVGITRGMRTVFMVPPGTDFFAVLIGILKIGAIPVLVDPGMGVHNLEKCMEEAAPEAFIGVPKAHIARKLLGWAKKSIRINVTVGNRYIWGGYTLKRIKDLGSATPYIITEQPHPEDMAILGFTSGNTGIPKGVVFTHGIISAQLNIIKEIYSAKDGDTDLATFPPFALFGPTCGIPAIIPEMDPAKPASADPRKLIVAINDYKCTSMFCSPALIEKIGRYCEEKRIKLSTFRRVISAGAPARMSSIERFTKILNPEALVLTPYGATEALPVTLIGSDILLNETRKRTDNGAGVCVGHPIEGMEIVVIKITEDPIDTWSDNIVLPKNQIGEIAVKGPVVTTIYYNRPHQTRSAKIKDTRDGEIWHRMGDVGYLDDTGRLWMCGRKVHRVDTAEGSLFSLPCEAIFNHHPRVCRSALVGIKKDGQTIPVICIELESGIRLNRGEKKQLTEELLGLANMHEHTKSIKTVLYYHRAFPVDIRHNAKILREKLALWAQKEIR